MILERRRNDGKNDTTTGRKGFNMKRSIAIVILSLVVLPLAADRPRVSGVILPPPSSVTYWASIHYATWTEVQSRLAEVGGKAALVHTGDPDYPFVLVEKWQCGSCVQYPPPLYEAEPQTGNYMPIGGKFKAATAPDGTALLVWRK